MLDRKAGCKSRSSCEMREWLDKLRDKLERSSALASGVHKSARQTLAIMDFIRGVEHKEDLGGAHPVLLDIKMKYGYKNDQGQIEGVELDLSEAGLPMMVALEILMPMFVFLMDSLQEFDAQAQDLYQAVEKFKVVKQHMVSPETGPEDRPN